MSDGLAAAIVFAPAGARRFFGAQPVFEVFGAHVYDLVEFSWDLC